jgi:hypothetical protein
MCRHTFVARQAFRKMKQKTEVFPDVLPPKDIALFVHRDYEEVFLLLLSSPAPKSYSPARTVLVQYTCTRT